VATIAVLGPGGVGGYVAGALARAGDDVIVIAREETAGRIARDGLRVDSVRLGSFTVRPRVATELEEEADVLVIATKAPALDDAINRIRHQPTAVVPLLNGTEHLSRLKAIFPGTLVGTIRIGAERTAPGRIVHTSPFAHIELAGANADRIAHRFRLAEIPTRVLDSETQVLWSKLARLCPLALSTAAADGPIGVVMTHPHRRVLLEGAIDETAAAANAEGAEIDPRRPFEELAQLDPSQTSSLHRDVQAGNESELDAIGGAVQRAARKHGIPTPSIDTLVTQIEARYPPA
jgi:2-dehydropantoate 2-reductase